MKKLIFIFLILQNNFVFYLKASEQKKESEQLSEQELSKFLLEIRNSTDEQKGNIVYCIFYYIRTQDISPHHFEITGDCSTDPEEYMFYLHRDYYNLLNDTNKKIVDNFFKSSNLKKLAFFCVKVFQQITDLKTLNKKLLGYQMSVTDPSCELSQYIEQDIKKT